MKYRFAMIGGAVDSFIGPVHRIAATLDGQAELVAGAFSRSAEKNRVTAEKWNVPGERSYTDYRELLKKEAADLDFVVVATPNSTHAEITRAAIEAGLAVSSDKPLGIGVSQGLDLLELVRQSGALVMLTHNYTGYPMIKEAREMCRQGDLGTIHRVIVEMPQGWLQGMITQNGEEPAMWRTDPAIVGPSLVTADVGTHAANLAEYVTGLRVTDVCADVSNLLKSSPLENEANVLLRFDNGAKGVLMVSQFATGERNPFRLRVYGDRLGLEWVQETPEWLIVKELSGNERRIYRGHSPEAVSSAWSRVPIGHPEGYLEAFANLYQEFYRALRDRKTGKDGGSYDFPDVADGVRGLRFIDSVLNSAAATASEKWVQYDE